MKFSKVLKGVDKQKAEAAERVLTDVLLEMALSPKTTTIVTKLGGDPFFYALISSIQHVATDILPTAATDGKCFYWNPSFILKLSPIGVRIVACHEALHASYMHPNRRGGREPKLWNLAVDYIVHKFIIDDFARRQPITDFLNFCNGPDNTLGVDGAAAIFKKHLGDYITLQDFKMIVDKYKTKDSLPKELLEKIKDVLGEGGNTINLPSPDIDTLDAETKKTLERRDRRKMSFYMDPAIPEDLATPEKIYEYLKQIKDSMDQSFGAGMGDTIFEAMGGATLDEHFDSSVEESEMAKRIYDAMQVAKQSAGTVPAGMEGELEELSQPVLRWQENIRSRIRRISDGNQKTDWTRFKSRHLFFGVITPKKISYTTKFHALCDTSGSMGDDDIAFAVSQIMAFKDKAFGTLVPADADVYWDKALKLDTINQQELKKFKVQGRGGTVFKIFFEEYKQKLGEADFLVVLTDGYLSADDYYDPKVPVYWIITSHNPDFNPPFGKVFHLYNDRL